MGHLIPHNRLTVGVGNDKRGALSTLYLVLLCCIIMQCDQMVKQKVAQFPKKLQKCNNSRVYLKSVDIKTT